MSAKRKCLPPRGPRAALQFRTTSDEVTTTAEAMTYGRRESDRAMESGWPLRYFSLERAIELECPCLSSTCTCQKIFLPQSANFLLFPACRDRGGRQGGPQEELCPASTVRRQRIFSDHLGARVWSSIPAPAISWSASTMTNSGTSLTIPIRASSLV
jgi:hypothetical protein